MKKKTDYTNEDIYKAQTRAELVVGRKFDIREVADVLSYTHRKCAAIGNELSYVPILFETELQDYEMRKRFTGRETVCA